ncbi:5-hydroxytryptamine receptor 1B-like [Hydractinia symbiolongicarpus]|uniref:5-hydroxytryptamine receptor 1B-like n=1 Tax=Hydractinia symbiolongicarpus TaxID=13093 RepID=UPI0025518AF6|nr:5-hydroxytryptamine receptor 1B-like [Hydractinia symbiolongicarpus]
MTGEWRIGELDHFKELLNGLSSGRKLKKKTVWKKKSKVVTLLWKTYEQLFMIDAKFYADKKTRRQENYMKFAKTDKNMNITCNTAYVGLPSLKEEHVILLIILNITIMTANILTNLFVIYSLVRTNQIRNHSIKLILYLSISDLLLAIIVQPFTTLVLFQTIHTRNCNVESIAESFSAFFSHTSAYITATIGLDRYVRVRFLNNFSKVLTKRRMHLILANIFVMSLVQSGLYVYGTQLKKRVLSRYISVTIDFFIVLAIIALYLLSIKRMRQYRRNSNFKKTIKKIDQRMTRLSSKILLSIGLIYSVYIIVAIPHAMLNNQVYGVWKQWLEFALILAYVLTFWNAFINAVLFLNANKKSRKRSSLRSEERRSTLNMKLGQTKEPKCCRLEDTSLLSKEQTSI